MSKYSRKFKRANNDFYETPEDAVKFLAPYLPERFTYYEPCVGNGKLIKGLAENTDGICVGYSDAFSYLYDLEGSPCIDAQELSVKDTEFDFFITNPPWTRKILHAIIKNLSNQRPTWVLFDGEWCFTKQSKDFRDRLRRVVPTYRIKWIAGTPHNSKSGSAWYLFDYPDALNVPKIMIGY